MRYLAQVARHRLVTAILLLGISLAGMAGNAPAAEASTGGPCTPCQRQVLGERIIALTEDEGAEFELHWRDEFTVLVIEGEVAFAVSTDGGATFREWQVIDRGVNITVKQNVVIVRLSGVGSIAVKLFGYPRG